MWLMQNEDEKVRDLLDPNIMGYVHSRIYGGRKPRDGQEKERVCRRFYAALVLMDLIHEVGALPGQDLKGQTS